jgi:hypothetical protein
MAKARSDYNAASPAGITDDTGNQLIGADTAGSQAFIMGAPLIREVQAGVANGDFAAPPADAAATITADNPLPYWTFTDVNSAGAITCAVVADTGNASGNILRWSVAGGTTTGKSATLTRYVIVPGSRNREFVLIPEMTLLNATASTAINVTIGFTWYKSDGTTTTGTGNTTSTSNTFTVIGAGPTTIAASSSAVNTAIPSSAAFMLITITVATTGTVSAGTKTVDLAEVRIASGQSDVYVAENTTPGTYGPSRFRQANGTLTLSPNLGGSGVFDVSGTMTNTVSSTDKLTILGGNIQSIGTATGYNVLQTFVTSDANNRFKLESNGKMSWGPGNAVVDSNLYRNTASPFGLITDGRLQVGENVYAANVNATTDVSGVTLTLTGAASATNLNLSGANGVRHDQPATTTATTNAAIWVVVSGTNYQLRRNSSSARYKTNIQDADDVVLEAAKRIKPRHFTSTIQDESGATRLGFIAEEIEAAGLTHAIGYDAEGRPETLDAVALIAALYHRVNELEERLAALE